MASPIALGRLLSRLDISLSDPRLQRSPYERNRVAANIEHARALLLTLEKQNATIRVQSQRQATETDLQAKRDWIKSLNTRLLELGTSSHPDDSETDDTFDDDDDDSNEDSTREREDILNKYAPAVPTEAGLETGGDPTSQQDPALLDTIQQQIQQKVQQELRSRKNEQQQTNLKSSDNKSTASTTAREQLFSGRSQQQQQQQQQQQNSSSGSKPELEKTEAMMSHNRTEQETLTQGLLGLARALKESSQTFGASLESEKDVLRRAEGGLDKNAQGMEAAERKMGTLRRMSEGQGWWGRIKLYAFIFGLWIACFLLVFVGPKLRL